MKVRELMSRSVIRIQADEPVTVAARAMSHYNIGAMPVCGADGRLCGMVSLADLARREESVMDAADALMDISDNLSQR